LITITDAEYARLLDDSHQLAHLEAMGVDNWDGYSYYKDEDEEDEDE
jgi:hypothetical protein